MIEGPDISAVAALIGNPANANMLLALMAGPALTATELAGEAGLAPPTVSGHLARLERAGLVAVERQGRHRYFRLADRDVAAALEALLPVAARAGHLRTRTGPRDPELRRARSCYDHLAGDLAVRLCEQLSEARVVWRRREAMGVTEDGRRYLAKRGIDVAALDNGRRPLCRPCLDWSERRCHLGGALGAAIFDLILARGWVARDRGTRVIRFGEAGEAAIAAWLSQ
jgi:DNA-binding transcriptional ArsR family regulator